MFFAAAGFVLTFDQPADTTSSSDQRLQSRSEDALATFYDDPLDDGRYGNNTMSKVLAESLSGDEGNLTDQLDATLPPGAQYSLHLNNGYGTYPVYTDDGSSSGESRSVTRLIEPKWTYTFLHTDLDNYPAASETSPAKMGVFALPVASGAPVSTGGSQVEIAVEGKVINDNIGENAFSLSSNHRVLQHEAGTSNPIPHSSLYFVDAGGDPIAFTDESGNNPRNVSYSVEINETAGVEIPAGTNLTITAPRGTNLSASASHGWEVLERKPDNETRGDFVINLTEPVEDRTQQVNFSVTWLGDEYDYRILRARLEEPGWGTARLLVERNTSAGYSPGDYSDVHVSGPRSMGTDTNGTWALALKHAEPSQQVADTSAQTMEVRSIDILQHDGHGIFDDVESVDVRGCSAGTWTLETPSHIRWDAGAPGIPDSDCELGENEELRAIIEVKSSGNGTPRDEEEPHDPPITYDKNDFTTDVDRPLALGFTERDVPADLDGIDGVGANWTGWPNDDISGTTGASTSSTYLNLLASLRGDTEYETSDVNTFKSALALGRVTTDHDRVPVGEQVKIDTHVQALMMALSENGWNTTLETNIYPPWSMGERDPMTTIEHTAKGAADTQIVGLATHDVTADDEPDVIVATTEAKAMALDGDDGVKISGLQKLHPDRTSTLLEKANLDANRVRFLWGFEGHAGDELVALDTDLAEDWAADLGSGDVAEITAENDYTGDGVDDVGVMLDNGRRFLLDGTDGSEVWQRSITRKGDDEIEEGVVGFEEEQSVVTSVGTKIEAGYKEPAIETEGDHSNRTKNASGEALNTIDATKDAIKSISYARHDAGILGINDQNESTYRYYGPGYGQLRATDLDANGVDDLVGGRWTGVVKALNGTQSSSPLSWLTIASGNTIRDAEAATPHDIVTVSYDGMFYFTDDAWTTTKYYWHEDANLYPFPNAVGLDVPTDGVAYVVHGTSGSRINYSVNGYVGWNELDYDVYPNWEARENSKAEEKDTELEWEDIEWTGSSRVDGILYGGYCDDLLDVDLDDLETDLDCSDAYIAYNPPDWGEDEWVEANITGDTEDRRINDVDFPPEGDDVGWNTDVAYAVGDQGAFYETTDSGEEWTQKDIVVDGETRTEDLHGVSFTGRDEGFAVGEDGVIFYTDDGGDTWAQNATPTDARLQDVNFTSESAGWAVGNGTTVLKTPDGGENWRSMATPSPENVEPWNNKPVFYSALVPRENAGWVFGGDTDELQTTRVLGYMTSWLKNATFQTDVVASHTNISEVRVHGDNRTNGDIDIDWYASNDGCSSWTSVPRKTTNEKGDVVATPLTPFEDDSHGDLCVKGYLTTSVTKAGYHNARIHGLKATYNYSDDGGDTWQEQTVEVDLTDGSTIDDAETTAVHDTSNGFLRAPLLKSFWETQLDGAVTDMLVHDVNSTNSGDEIVVGTGDQWETWEKTQKTGTDRRIYQFDAETGVLLDESDPLDGRVTQISNITSLENLTADGDADIVASVHGPNLVGGYDSDKLVALNGTNLTDVLWEKGLPEKINDLETNDLNRDGHHEAIVGTNDNGTETRGSGVVESEHGDTPAPDIQWTSYPAFNEKYTHVFDVPLGLPFGPYIVESQIYWDDADVSDLDPGEATQSARLYDSFVVAEPNGDVPESPLYRLELSTWYEGER